MKILKSRIFQLALTAIIFTGIGAYANDLFAEDIAYKNTTVSKALDDLYQKANYHYISLSGSTSVRSNSSHSYDVSYIEGYENFTSANFVYSFLRIRWVGTSPSVDITSITYDNTTGIVTFPGNIGGTQGSMIDIEYYPILIY